MAKWVQDSSSAIPTTHSTVKSDKGSRSIPKTQRKNHNSNAESGDTTLKNQFETLSAQGQLALEIGINGLTHKTEAVWSTVLDTWSSIVPPSCSSPTLKPAKSPQAKGSNTAMLFAQYEKSRRSRMKHVAGGQDGASLRSSASTITAVLKAERTSSSAPVDASSSRVQR